MGAKEKKKVRDKGANTRWKFFFNKDREYEQCCTGAIACLKYPTQFWIPFFKKKKFELQELQREPTDVIKSVYKRKINLPYSA